MHGSSGPANELDAAAVEAARSFVRWQGRHEDPTIGANFLAVGRVKGRDEDFAQINKEFHLVPNVINTESILFYGSDVGSRMVEPMSLPCDCHAMCHREKTTEEFVEKLWRESCASKCLVIIYLSSFFLVFC